MISPSTMSADTRRAGLRYANIWMMCVFSSLIGARVMLSLFALSLGAGVFEVGVVAASTQLPMLFLSVPVALAMDRYGSRPVLWASGACGLVAVLLPFFFPVMPAVLAASIFFGLSNVLGSQPLQKLIGAFSDQSTLARNFSTYSFLGAVAGVIGPFAGGLAIDAWGPARGMLVMLPLELAALAMLAFGGRMLPGPAPAKEAAGLGALRETLRDRRVWGFIAMSNTVALALELYPFFLPLHGHAAGYSASVIGALVAVISIGAMLLPLVLAWSVRKLGEHRVMALCLGFVGLSFLMLAAGTNVWLLGASAFLYGFATCACSPVTAMLAYRHLPPLRAGQFLALRNTGNAAVRVVVSPLFGALAGFLGLPAVFVLLAAVMGVAGWHARRQGPEPEA
jgi:MFS family permease